MNKYIWLGCLFIVLLTGCGDTKEEEQVRKANEFRTISHDDSGDGAKKEKLYKECRKKNVRSLVEIRDEAKRISGNDNIGSKEFQSVFRPMDHERDVALAKCIKIRTGH